MIAEDKLGYINPLTAREVPWTPQDESVAIYGLYMEGYYEPYRGLTSFGCVYIDG